jgi:hypothetical protein
VLKSRDDFLEDFLFKHGNIREGLKHAFPPALILVVLPVAVIQLILVNPNSIFPAINDDLRGLLNELMVSCLIFGIVVAEFGFFRGFYPKGTYSRLAFSIIEAGFLILYSYILFYSSRLPEVLQQIDYQLDLSRLFLLSLYPVLLIAVEFASEFPWNRKTWLKSLGQEIPLPPESPYQRSMEFSLKLGIVPEANKQARSSLLSFIILPVLLILIVPPLVAVYISLPTEVNELLAALSNAANLMLVLGIPLFVIAWFFGLYQKGSFGRLTLGLVYAAFLVLYIFEVLGTTNLEQGLIDLSVNFDYDLFVILIMIVPLFVAISTLGELVDEHNAWKQRLGLPVKIKPLNLESKWLDFHPRVGKIGDGAKLSLRAYVLFIIVPAVVLTLISESIDDMDFQNSIGLADVFIQVLDAIIVFSIIIVILSFFRGFYPKGTFSRAVFGVLVIAFMLILLNAAFLEGGLKKAFSDSGATLDFDLILLVLLLYITLGFVGVLAELIDNRRTWKKIIGRKVKPWKQEEKPNLLTDFHLRNARFVKGTKGAKKAFRGYALWPSLFLVLVIASLNGNNDSTTNESISTLEGLVSVAIIFSIPVIIAQFFRGSYPRGAISRWVFGMVAVVFIFLWNLKFWGGFLNEFMNSDVNPDNVISTLQSPMSLTGVVIIFFIIWASIKAIRFTREYFKYRDNWVRDRKRIID